MIQKKLVSIVVPIYNVEKYLEKCLNSIYLQTYSNIEVIMVDDGSKDSSTNIAKEYEKKDSRFQLYSKENGGLSSARNYGMEYAKGEYICFIDSDDFIGKNFVSSLLKAFDEETDIVISDYAIYNYKNKKFYLPSQQLPEDVFVSREDKKRLLSYLFTGERTVMPVWKNMYRTLFLKENKMIFISERLVYAEDELFHVEAYTKANKIKMISKIEFFHLIVPGSLSQGYRANYFEMQKMLDTSILKYLEEYYQEDFVNEYKNKFPASIGASMLVLCKCNFKDSIKNMKNLLNDNLVKEWYKKQVTRTGLMRYWLLYKIGFFKSPLLIVLTVKVMIFFLPIFRKIQQTREYKIEEG